MSPWYFFLMHWSNIDLYLSQQWYRDISYDFKENKHDFHEFNKILHVSGFWIGHVKVHFGVVWCVFVHPCMCASNLVRILFVITNQIELSKIVQNWTSFLPGGENINYTLDEHSWFTWRMRRRNYDIELYTKFSLEHKIQWMKLIL